MSSSDIQLVLATVGGVVALLTLWKGVAEYRRQGMVRRIEFFLEARSRLKTNEDYARITGMLEHDSEELRREPMGTKIAFVGFFEEIALLVNARVIRPEIAQYMFGYYALKCWDSTNFWILDERPERPLDKEGEPYWAVFRGFVEEMRKAQTKLLERSYANRDFSL